MTHAHASPGDIKAALVLEARLCLRVGLVFAAIGLAGALVTGLSLTLWGKSDPTLIAQTAATLGAGAGFVGAPWLAGRGGAAPITLRGLLARVPANGGTKGTPGGRRGRALVRGFWYSKRRFALWVAASAVAIVYGFAVAAETAGAQAPASEPYFLIGSAFLGFGFWQLSFTLAFERLRLVRAHAERPEETGAGTQPA